MKLSVIMPTYNEAPTLNEIIRKVQDVDYKDKEIIIVDDGSTDNTKAILDNYKNHENITVVHHAFNQGKGKAIRTGREHVTGDIVIIQDADLETDPDDYLHLIAPVLNRSALVVYGSRLLNCKVSFSWKYYWGGRFVTLAANWLYNQKITDEPACYKVFNSDFFKSIPLKCKRFDFCPEITAKVSKRGVKIVELPMRYYPRTIAEGKKLRIRDGIWALWVLLKYKFID